jgi:hypothetical protein
MPVAETGSSRSIRFRGMDARQPLAALPVRGPAHGQEGNRCRSRIARLTNGFSKELLQFCRIHKSLRVTPAMESNLTDHVWELAELLA